MKTSFLQLGFVAFLSLGVFSGLADANAPAGRYTTSTGIVYDTKTKLTWQQTSPSTTYTLAMGAAAAYCTSLGTTLGGSGWRVPTVKELLTLIDYSLAANPPGPPAGPTAAMDPVFQFQGSGPPPIFFWSSTAVAGSTTAAWSVNILMGVTSGDSTNISHSVRCVR